LLEEGTSGTTDLQEGASDNTTALKERTLDNIEHADIEEDPSASSADSQLAILKCPPSEEPQPSP
jgi:hypothetical protein